MLKVWAHADFADSDAFIDQSRVTDIAPAQDFDQHVTDVFPRPQLPLGRAR
jgi:hypothetical protein